MSEQNELSLLLKGKGIGPGGSKCLKTEQIEQLPTLFASLNCSLSTKATLLTALLCLPPTAEEEEFITRLKEKPTELLPKELWGFLIEKEATPFQQTINRIISHENLSYEEAKQSIQYLFTSAPDYQKAAFLEGQRLKRETFDENRAFFTVLQKQVNVLRSNKLSLLVDFGDSYDGCNRIASLNLFVASILASLGYPSLVHSVDEVAPKKGITHQQILKAAGKEVYLSQEDVLAKLEDPETGIAYLDQKVYHHEVFALKQLREDMVKRPFLATFEKMLQPIRASKNYLLTQYTHKHYKDEIAKLVSYGCEFEAALHIKGMEGTSMINPLNPSASLYITPQKTEEVTIDGKVFGFDTGMEKLSVLTPKSVLGVGISVLKGEDVPARKFIQFQCVAILHHLFGLSVKAALYDVRQSIDTGSALKHWENL